MSLNISKGNMYGFVTHSWNAIKGKCPHGCTYCYMNRFGEQKPVRLDEKELKTDLGSGNIIFVGSSCDMFADDIPIKWSSKVIDYCKQFDNTYLWQTKNTFNLYQRSLYTGLPPKSIVCTTIESNIYYDQICPDAALPEERAIWLRKLPFERHVTIEPIMYFDMDKMVDLIRECDPKQVNIGANTNHKIKLPEPSPEKVYELIERLEDFTIVHLKDNLNRLLK